MRDERRKEERNKQGQTNNKAKQHQHVQSQSSYLCRLTAVVLYIQEKLVKLRGNKNSSVNY